MKHKKIKPKIYSHQRDGYIGFKKGRDNQGYYNGNGGRYNSNQIRIPSLKANKHVWTNFYRLFPDILKTLLDEKTDKEIKNDVITVKRIAAHNGKMIRVRRTKYKKIW